MATYIITHSRKGDAKEEHELVGVCISNQFYTKAEVYDYIGEGHIFYSKNPGYPNVPDAKVGQRMYNGQKCIQTGADKTVKNNLLNLPDC